jgi:hypothetical protein
MGLCPGCVPVDFGHVLATVARRRSVRDQRVALAHRLGAFIGKEEQPSLGIIERLVNQSGGVRGRPIKFVIADDQSNGVYSFTDAEQRGIGVMGDAIFRYDSEQQAFIPASKPGGALK